MQPTDAEIAQRLRAILDSEAFRPDRSQWLRSHVLRLLAALARWIHDLPPAARWATIAACVVTLVGLAVHTWMLLEEGRARGSGSGRGRALSRNEPAATPESLLERAHALAAADQLRDAARALQQAVFMHLCLRKQVPWRDSTADWEWLQLLQPDAAVVELTRATQRLAFGPAAPTRAAFDACLQQARAWVQGRPAA